MDQIYYQSAISQAKLIRTKEISAQELLQLHFERIDHVNPSINAIVWQDREGALQLAKQLDQEAAKGEWRGPLHGVPITVKDAFDLVGSPSTWGDPQLIDNYPAEDADVVARYKAAGANVFGKTNVPLNLVDWQSFNEIYGTTHNPWDLSRTPGGSSGGSAAALATGMTALEAGSDIGSSIRNPAHYSGVYGLKPTWNVVPLRGHMPPGWVSDIDIAVTGPMARTAEDLSLAFDLLAGSDHFADPAWRVHCPADERKQLKDFKVALKLDDPASPVDSAYSNCLAAFAQKLEATGAMVVEAEPELDSQTYFELYMRLLGAARSVGVSEETIAHMRAVPSAEDNPVARHLLDHRLDGVEMKHADWQVAHNERRLMRMLFDQFFADYDILLCPVCAGPAFPIDEEGGRYERFIIVNGESVAEIRQMFWAGYSGVVGLPSTVGPAGQVAGLPVGYQAIAGYGRDRTALAFSEAVAREIGGFVAPPDYA
ncbi:MAG: amidase [Thiolinea sp.]